MPRRSTASTQKAKLNLARNLTAPSTRRPVPHFSELPAASPCPNAVGRSEMRNFVSGFPSVMDFRGFRIESCLAGLERYSRTLETVKHKYDMRHRLRLAQSKRETGRHFQDGSGLHPSIACCCSRQCIERVKVVDILAREYLHRHVDGRRCGSLVKYVEGEKKKTFSIFFRKGRDCGDQRRTRKAECAARLRPAAMAHRQAQVLGLAPAKFSHIFTTTARHSTSTMQLTCAWRMAPSSQSPAPAPPAEHCAHTKFASSEPRACSTWSCGAARWSTSA